VATCLKAAADGTALAIRVTPRAARAHLAPERDGRLLVRVTAPPADGEANVAICKLIAKALRVPKTSLEITAGQSARDKTVIIHGVATEDVESRLGAYFSAS
jgi:uncharacterized protein (TIGR00251 family)